MMPGNTIFFFFFKYQFINNSDCKGSHSSSSVTQLGLALDIHISSIPVIINFNGEFAKMI